MLSPQAFIRLCRARDRLREVHDRRLTIDEVAREAAMSPFHFIRLFSALFGETPHQLRLKATVERAKELLTHTNASVTAVCMEVGFSSLGSFSDRFTRQVGTPPSVYRRRIRSILLSRGNEPNVRTPGCLTLMGAAFATLEKRGAGEPATLGL